METVSNLVSRALMAAVLAVGAVAPASAGYIDLTGLTPGQSSAVPVTGGGHSLIATADTFRLTGGLGGAIIRLDGDSDAEVTVSGEGLGVDNEPTGTEDDRVDALNSFDILLLSFSSTVILESIDFANISGNEPFAVFALDSLPPPNTSFLGAEYFVDASSIFNFTPGVAGRVFGIGAIEGLDPDTNQIVTANFRIEGLTVVDSPSPTPLMLSGIACLAFLAYVRRRRS